MNKAPAFQFYVRDWIGDPELSMASHSTKGIWIDLLCFMWQAKEQGKLTGTKEHFVKMLRASEQDFDIFLDEVNLLKFADVTECNRMYTVSNRRMYGAYKERKNTRIRVAKHRKKQASNKKVTPPSSTSSSSSTSTTNNKHIPQQVYEEYRSRNNTLPSCQKFTTERKQKCKTRLNEPDYFNSFCKAVDKAQSVPFLCGDNNNGWKANFDWFIANDTNVVKVLEGKYDSPEPERNPFLD